MSPLLQTSWTRSVLRGQCHFFPLTRKCCLFNILVWQAWLRQSVGVFSTHFTTQTSATITTVKGNSDSQNPVVVDETWKQHCTGLRSYCLMKDQNQLPCSYSPTTSRKQWIMNHHQWTLTIVILLSHESYQTNQFWLTQFSKTTSDTLSVFYRKKGCLWVHPFHQVRQVVNFRRPVEVELRRMDQKTIL